MDLDIRSFLHRLEQEGAPAGAISALVEAEIAKAQDLKLGFADEIDREPEFIGQAFRRIDEYTEQLRGLLKWFPRPVMPDWPDEFMTGSVFREKVAAFLSELSEQDTLGR